MKLPRNCRFQQIAYAISPKNYKKIETRIKEIIHASILAQRRNFSTEDLLYRLAWKGFKMVLLLPVLEKGQNAKKALYNRENIESRYVNHRLHLYSKQLIDFCIEQQAATLILKNQEDKIGIAKEQKFVLRNWSYYELQAKIKYKAEKAGIELIIG